MSRVITFSRKFPAYHPKAGQSTYFVEKIWKGLHDAESSNYIPFDGYWQKYDKAFPVTFDEKENIHMHSPKWHTIRGGNRWKAGDKFSPRVWSGKPYNSPQIEIAPDITVEQVWEFQISDTAFLVNGELISADTLCTIATNDGLTISDMADWFKFPTDFKGQIISWSKNLKY